MGNYVHRETVSKYVSEFQNRPNAPTGSEDDESTKPDVRPGPKRTCEPFRDVIQTKLEQGLSAQRIYQVLVTDRAFTAKYPSGRHRFHREEVATPERFTVPIEKVGPGIRRAIRAGVDAVFFQNVPHCLSTDLRDADLA